MLYEFTRSTVKKTSSSKKSKSKEVKEYNPEDFEFGLLPPPIHAGKYLRDKRCEFKLPYDLWWLYKNKQVSIFFLFRKCEVILYFFCILHF